MPLAMMRSIVLAALVAASANVAAQQTPASPAPAQQAVDVNPDAVLRGALQVLALIDQGKAGEVWDGATQVARRAVTREAFVQKVAADRSVRGTPVARTWVSVSRQQVVEAGQAPAGAYVSVNFATSFRDGKVATELVSFRVDEDRVLRVSGYVLR